MTALKQCPYDKACKCAMDESCEGCEAKAESVKMKLYRAESSDGEKIKFHAVDDSDARHWIINHCNCSAEWTFREEK